MQLTDAEITIAVEAALRAVSAASALINKCIEERDVISLEIHAKSSAVDLVTRYDKQAEEEVLAILHAATPHYDVLSEEMNSDAVLSSRPAWVVDPIDGTTSFVHGLFDCCVSIALVVDKEPIIGVVAAPRLQEVFSAIKGRGAYRNGQRIAVSSCKDIAKAVVSVHQPYNRSPSAVASTVSMQRELALIPVHGIRCYGAAALDMCSVACGRLDMYYEVGIHAWDIAAGTIIVREAGGVVHDVDGTEPINLMARNVCCASSRELSNVAVGLSSKFDYYNTTLEVVRGAPATAAASAVATGPAAAL